MRSIDVQEGDEVVIAFGLLKAPGTLLPDMTPTMCMYDEGYAPSSQPLRPYASCFVLSDASWQLEGHEG